MTFQAGCDPLTYEDSGGYDVSWPIPAYRKSRSVFQDDPGRAYVLSNYQCCSTRQGLGLLHQNIFLNGMVDTGYFWKSDVLSKARLT